jgi:hypothetical protein
MVASIVTLPVPTQQDEMPVTPSLEALRAGDPGEVRRVLEALLPRLRGWLFRLLGPSGDVDDVAAASARQVGVVEDDPACACFERLVEHACEPPQGPAALVAIESHEAAGDVLGGHAGLPRARDAHHNGDFTRSHRTRTPARAGGNETSSRGVVEGLARLGITPPADGGQTSIPDLSTLPAPVREVFQTAFAEATGHIFLLATPFAGLALLAILMIREVPLRTTIERADELEPAYALAEPVGEPARA